MTSLRSRSLALAFSLLAPACSSVMDGSNGPNCHDGKCDDGDQVDLPSDVLTAAQENLRRISKEIDADHLANYKLSGSIDQQFMDAERIEYGSIPEMYKARMSALASMVFFAAPDIMPPENGHKTPFHGLDMDQFQALINVEDAVFNQHVSDNGGSTQGVRPFSVCETTFIIETYTRPKVEYPGYEAYREAYKAYAATCPQADLDDWYNFRGLGGLRPSWVESNIQDRFLRRMAKNCTGTVKAGWADECAKWDQDRLGYRLNGNRQLATREMYYDPSDEEYVTNPYNALVLMEDKTGDGVGDVFKPGPVSLTSGEQGTLDVSSTGQFSGVLKYTDPQGHQRNIAPQDMVPYSAVDPAFKSEWLDTPDLGMMTRFADPAGCTADVLDPAQCPLLKRFYSMIDRHEYFYNTYSALTPNFSGVSSQPSPLVACSITLGASHVWDTAGTPAGGTAGFIFLMRIPFAQILAGQRKSISTLDPGPEVTAIQDLYDGSKSLDLSKLWLDIATLSNNQYESEHEISKFGAVPAEQIEGILVVRKPAAMP